MIIDVVMASRLAVFTAMVTLITGCMKDNHPWIPQLVANIETVDQWSRTPEWGEHASWLNRSVAWDIVLAVASTWAIRDLDEEERSDELLRSGLTEVAAGPGDHVTSLVSGWRQTLGSEKCRIGTASDDDLRWMRERLTLPPPKGAGPESQKALAGYAKRASDTRDIVRVDCGGAAHLLVGVLAGKLVPILRE